VSGRTPTEVGIAELGTNIMSSTENSHFRKPPRSYIPIESNQRSLHLRSSESIHHVLRQTDPHPGLAPLLLGLFPPGMLAIQVVIIAFVGLPISSMLDGMDIRLTGGIVGV
jgi:hypothetical protein